MQDACLDVYVDIIALSKAKGNPVELDFPAMQIAVDINVGIAKILVLDVVPRRPANFPVFGYADIATKIHGLGYVGFLVDVFGIGQVVTYRKRPRDIEVNIKVWVGIDEGRLLVVKVL